MARERTWRRVWAVVLALGDEPCVALHALRAAAMGEPESGPALCWLSKRSHADAAAWLDVLRSQKSLPNEKALLTCSN